MKRKALFALIVLSAAISIGGCSLLHVAGPPCVGNSCPAGASGQLPTTLNAANPPAPDNNTQAKNADAPAQHRSLASRLHITHGQ